MANHAADVEPAEHRLRRRACGIEVGAGVVATVLPADQLDLERGQFRSRHADLLSRE